jgi:hypothetical protein
MARASAVALGMMLPLACAQKNDSPPPLAPMPLPALGTSGPDAGDEQQAREALFEVEQVPIWGEELPSRALAIEVDQAIISIAGARVDRLASNWSEQVLKAIGKHPAVMLSFDPERYLADVAELFALLAATGREVWLRHPDAAVAFKVILFDNGRFERWLNEPKPGKIRVIQRADGFELQTNIGKMPGADPNGPTIPSRGGKIDIARLRRALALLKERFPNAQDSCLVPSYGTELPSIARALSGYYRGNGKRIFDALCLVYPPAGRAPAAPAPR